MQTVSKVFKSLVTDLGTVGFVVWALSLTLMVGIALGWIHNRNTYLPPVTADWQCGLDPRDNQPGGCMETLQAMQRQETSDAVSP